jgi:uncharacterized repeat protein (TIGR03803 family)
MNDLNPSRKPAAVRRAGGYLFLLPALIAVLNWLSVGQASAQTFTSLGNFNRSYDNFNFSNDSPFFLGNTLYASLHQLVLSGNTFYCVALGEDNESFYSGALYAVSTDGTGFTNLYNFTTYSHYVSPYYVNADGAFPNAPLILSGATLYGTAYRGGANGAGTVFAVNTNGTGFTVLFTSDYPQAGLILSGNTLYGTTSGSPYGGLGAVFAVNTNGTGFRNLYQFTGSSDGAGPQAGLLLSGNTLYGTSRGGSSNAGTVFALKTNGTGFTNLHNFTGSSDGANPKAGLILLGNTLYGTASGGGSSGNGTVFSVKTDGTGFTNLHSFAPLDPTYYTNSDGAVPLGPLAIQGNTLYGTTSQGGSLSQGSSLGGGTLFSISFQPQLTIARSGTTVILSWPTNVAGFDYTGYTLQSTTNAVSPAIWSTSSPAPVVIAGRNTVTNPITGARQFYRLVQ